MQNRKHRRLRKFGRGFLRVGLWTIVSVVVIVAVLALVWWAATAL